MVATRNEMEARPTFHEMRPAISTADWTGQGRLAGRHRQAGCATPNHRAWHESSIPHNRRLLPGLLSTASSELFVKRHHHDGSISTFTFFPQPIFTKPCGYPTAVFCARPALSEWHPCPDETRNNSNYAQPSRPTAPPAQTLRRSISHVSGFIGQHPSLIRERGSTVVVFVKDVPCALCLTCLACNRAQSRSYIAATSHPHHT
ncbi:hypothetical protein B0T19DRAFT_89875 [Cercophora scortea]|uniref:Uncharacterized protein n=1 Tax=Cercophora scortea TaxID=314031 RepID=A0AAE0IVD5_9PEZI|nr:hypothetical protein B0T19DRAFT_89875 [Cercophora scortea]